MVMMHHRAFCPVPVGAAVPITFEALMRTELLMEDAALQGLGCRECLGPHPEEKEKKKKKKKVENLCL